MRDAKGPDPKVLCVPTADPRQADLVDLADREHVHKLEIQHFFDIYQDLEPGKSIDAEHGAWADRLEAEAEIARSQQRAHDEAPSPRTSVSRRLLPGSTLGSQTRTAPPAGSGGRG